MSGLEERIFAEIERAAPARLLGELVRIPSHPGVDRQEAGVAAALAAYLEKNGLSAELSEVVDGRPNLLCTVDGTKAGPHLLLCGHMDTVPLNVDGPGHGFSGEIREGRVLGRGSVDMKGALAAKAAALVALEHCQAPSHGRVTLAAVIDEEMESLGVEKLISDGFSADGAIVGEPTQNDLCVGHKGLEWLKITFTGASTHGGTPGQGVSAIAAAARFIELARTELIPRWESRAHPLLGSPTLNIGTISGGDQPSTVAASCVLQADRRSIPGENYALIHDELRELLEKVESQMPGLKTEVCRAPGAMATLEHVALATAREERVVVAASTAQERVRGSRRPAGVFPAWTDGSLLSAYGAIPTVVMGPGDLALAHSPREAIAVSDILEAARLYAVTALEFCSST